MARMKFVLADARLVTAAVKGSGREVVHVPGGSKGVVVIDLLQLTAAGSVRFKLLTASDPALPAANWLTVFNTKMTNTGSTRIGVGATDATQILEYLNWEIVSVGTSATFSMKAYLGDY